MENNGNRRYGKRSLASKIWLAIARIKMYLIFILILATIIATAYIVRSCRGTQPSTYVNDKINATPTQILAMKEIGEWEFLSIEDEEMIDTVRKGFFTNDDLVRIYYGTLRLGIDMSKVKKDWIKRDGDTLTVTLPPISLLDEDFIDEARTQSFFESGTWTDADREAMYKRAYAKMKERCLTKKNIESAQTNASRQFYKMFKAMGVENVKIRFDSSN